MTTSTAALLAAAMRRKQTTPNTYTVSGSSVPSRILSLFDLILLGVGGTLGSGLFLLSGRTARNVAGPAVSVSFLIAAVACLFSALSYAEMSSRLPNSGGAYAFSYSALGELPAFLVGMCLTLEYGISSAAITRSLGTYLGDAIPIFPSWFTGNNSQISVLGALLILVIAALLTMGMHHAKWVINAGTLLYASVVILIIALGSNKIDKENWDPFFPYGFQGAVTGASVVFFSYIGFDEVATMSEEAHNASTNVPLAITISLLIVTVAYIFASLVLTGTVNYKDLDLDAPFSAAMRAVGLPVIAKMVGIGTALGMMNTALVGFTAQPRIFVSMGRDGLLPRAFAFSTRTTTMGCGLVIMMLALVVDTQSLADVVSGGTLLAFLSTNLSVLLTRYRIHARSRRGPFLIYLFAAASALAALCARLFIMRAIPIWLALIVSVPTTIAVVGMLYALEFEGGPACERMPPTFLCPFVPAVPLAGAFTTVFLLIQLSIKALTVLVLWLCVSTTTYFFYSARNALIANEYHAVDGSSTHSFNSFEDLAMEAHSVLDSEEKDLGNIADVPDMNIEDLQSVVITGNGNKSITAPGPPSSSAYPFPEDRQLQLETEAEKLEGERSNDN